MLNRGRCPEGEPVDRRQRKPPTPAVSYSSHASARLSYPSTLSVRRRRRRDQSCLPVHGFPLALLGYHPRLRMVRLRRRRLCVDADAEEV